MTLSLPDWYAWLAASPEDPSDHAVHPAKPFGVIASRDSAAPTSDAVLVDRVRAGDADALRAIYEQHYRMLWELAYTMVGNSSAEDVVHDVFTTLWNQRERLVIRHGLRAYLYGAVRHRALNLRRHDRFSTRAHQSIQPEIESVPGFGALDPTPVERAEATALEAALRQAIEALPTGQRDAVLLHWRHGLSNAEVASVMGISTNAATVQIARARATLRRMLASWLDHPPQK